MELLFFILGMAVGVAAIYIWLTAKSDGTLRIDSSDPDGPYKAEKEETAIYEADAVVVEDKDSEGTDK